MPYHISKTVDYSFDEAIQRATDALKTEGFGVLTEIDVKDTLKQKLNTDFRDYRILGACNPEFAHQALLKEDKIGTMLPCNVIVQVNSEGKVEVSAVDPKESMAAVQNKSLADIADQVRERLQRVIDNL
ncbi:MAG: DUF302 domain-containing protein [candidate division Zixibacteria bacterium]|nr:DUF302 domain-containing protein [candidate division Zixibacteria bacterium]NIR63676.1 DUF302 domain-containing protein [candidate division Zixibacteria bacterium]NIS18327.1 DUF302 domain-containing protein [candidate division Zixibacteria bacterium]NIS45629.1 DUF302 domain-containing protein [candidate division Zixibacteria bacterium]NIT54654.1 DUF302 domain-containing protein [candidate division Zixibacteria bacterium]